MSPSSSTFESLSYTYDTNGNLTTSTEDGVTTEHTYDPLDRLQTLTTEGNTTEYWYGAERDRIAKRTSGYTHLYPSPYTEYTRNGHNDALLLGATRLATVDDTTTRYHVKDHLQSTSLTIGEDGSLHEAIQYTPYGQERERTGSYQSSHTYTDQINDYESSLMYYNARYYSPTTRTFTSGDPVAIMEPGTVLQTPQLLNPYSYVGNNPIIYNDPNGELPALALPLALGTAAAGTLYAYNRATGNTSSAGMYAGAFAAGAAAPYAARLSGPGIGGFLRTGASIGIVSGSVQQGIDLLSGEQEEFNKRQLVGDAFFGVLGAGMTSTAAGIRIPVINSGRNNFSAIRSSLETKYFNGSINNISTKSIGKIVASYAAVDAPADAASRALESQVRGLLIEAANLYMQILNNRN